MDILKLATLSQAGGAPSEGAETTWGLEIESLSVLNDRLERPAPKRRILAGIEAWVMR